jgi:DNA replication protein DnaC
LQHPRPRGDDHHAVHRGGAVRALRCGRLAGFDDRVAAEQWVAPLLQWEEDERARRSLERRIRDARLGNFKPLCDFDWSWPTRCDRLAVEELMLLGFVRDTANVVLIGPKGGGKSTLALNLAYQALVHSHTALFTTAGQMLGELAALDSDSALRRRLRRYASPDDLRFNIASDSQSLSATRFIVISLTSAIRRWR